jgi:hypothetical protein
VASGLVEIVTIDLFFVAVLLVPLVSFVDELGANPGKHPYVTVAEALL